MLKKVNSELFFYYLGKSVSQSKLLSSLRLKKFEIRNTFLFEKLGTYLLSLTDRYVGYLDAFHNLLIERWASVEMTYTTKPQASFY